MKKLLLLNNLLLILSIGKCANDRVAKNAETQPVQDSLSAIADTTLTDSLTYAAQLDSLALDTMKTPPISKEDKYNARPNKPKEAPKHNAPDQAKIDSLKEPKKKGKGGG
jgi:hypothetical protein